jgi:hypothetical protein
LAGEELAFALQAPVARTLPKLPLHDRLFRKDVETHLFVSSYFIVSFWKKEMAAGS